MSPSLFVKLFSDERSLTLVILSKMDKPTFNTSLFAPSTERRYILLENFGLRRESIMLIQV